MKLIPFLLLCLVVGNVFAQTITEKESTLPVDEVTVFIEGAQITSKKTIDIPQGTSSVRFTGLSPFIDAKSIQVKVDGEINVLSVNHQQNFLDQTEKPAQLTDLEDKLKALDEKIKLENTYIDIVNEDLSFLQANKSIGGKNQEVSVTNLKDAATYYSSRFSSLKMSEIDHTKNITELTKQRTALEEQLKTIRGKKVFASGEIVVKIESPRQTSAHFQISYLVKNAGWFPSYDIRVKDISQPVEVVYKANVRQDTKIDWKNVKLKFSSSNPNVSGVAPELATYFLDYNTAPPRYNLKSNNVTGKITDTKMQALPYVAILVKGTTIGTTSDINGNYSITVPNGYCELSYSFIGFKTKTVPVYSEVMNIILEEEKVALSEVVVSAYGIEEKEEMVSSLPGVSVDSKKSKKTMIRGINSISAAPVEKQTTVEFEIKNPYSINSDNKNYSVDMSVIQLPAFYTYYAVPKIDKSAFLQAGITDWEKYNLMQGEATIFFENTYIGKTILDVKEASDTLLISLGQDKNVAINREKVREYTTKQFIGTKKEETRTWKTTVKNNKAQKIEMIILDQVPISTMDEIEVNVHNASGAKPDPETGAIRWEFSLSPSESKDLELKYSVKYPKNRRLLIE